MNLECKLQTAVSKTGNEYVYISVKIGGYEKKVFLDKAEEELIKVLIKTNPQK